MAINVTWLIEGHVLYNRIEGMLTTEELRAGSAQMRQMLDQGEHKLVHALFDLTRAQGVPLQISTISEITQPFLTHPNTGWIIAFGTQNGMIRMISSIVSQTFRTRFRFYPEREEAIHMLQSLDATLPDLQFLLMEAETLPKR